MLKVEMLSTGDEVLYGQIVDTNAAWLADYLFHHALPMTRRNTVGDSLHDLVAVLQERSLQADILIVNGGLGPTSDDLSAEAAAMAAGVGLVEHSGWLARMEAYFSERGRVMAPSNRKQALIPEGSEMVDNPVGTACGFALRLNRCLIFFTPGVPSEFKQMVDQKIMPLIRARFPLPEPPLCLRMTTFGTGESNLAQRLQHLVLPEGVVMGYRSSMPIIELKLTGPAAQSEAMQAIWPEVRRIAAQSVIFEGTEGLPSLISRALQARGYRMTLSEQFTGGLVNLQLCREQAPLLASEILPVAIQSLQHTLDYALTLRAQRTADIALVLSEGAEEQTNFVLITPDGQFGFTIQFGLNRYSLATRQEVCALMGLNILWRWFEGKTLVEDYGWIKVLETFQVVHDLTAED